MDESEPVGYRVQKGIPCCANCLFGGYLGAVEEIETICICEILGRPSDGDYAAIAKAPLGLCDVYKPNV